MDIIYLLVLGSVLVAAFVGYKYKKSGVLVGVPTISMIQYRKNPTAIADAISSTSIAQKKNLVYLSSPFISMAIATHPDVAREILKNDDHFPKRPGFNTIFGTLFNGSLVLVNGDNWKHQRSTMSPAFHFDYLKGMIPLFTKKTEELLDMMPKEELFEAKNWMYHFTVDILGLAAFGVDFKTMSEGESNAYYKAYQDMMKSARKSMSNLVPYWIRERLPLPDVKRARAARDVLRQMTNDILASRKEATEKHYLVDMMLEAQPSFTSHELRANTFLFFLAGHETTASALSWALYLLAEHPDKQERVREEVDRKLGGKHIESEDLKELTYLDMFIKEVLRFGSPIPFVGSRAAAADTYLDGIFVPKNTGVGIGIHAIHHNPEFWPSPEVFNPDRFAPNLAAKHHPFAFLPFSLGKRVCIGNMFSLIEQKLFLAMLLQRYVVGKDKSNTTTSIVLDPSTLARVPLTVNIILKKR